MDSSIKIAEILTYNVKYLILYLITIRKSEKFANLLHAHSVGLEWTRIRHPNFDVSRRF